MPAATPPIAIPAIAPVLREDDELLLALMSDRLLPAAAVDDVLLVVLLLGLSVVDDSLEEVVVRDVVEVEVLEEVEEDELVEEDVDVVDTTTGVESADEDVDGSTVVYGVLVKIVVKRGANRVDTDVEVLISKDISYLSRLG